MTILTDIYNRPDVTDDLTELQKPYFHHGQLISDHITVLIGYVEHVTAVIQERQRRHKLTDIEAGYILPALNEINTLMGEKLSKGEKPNERLSDRITDLIGLVGWWILHIENRNVGRASR
ncbi:hypothetical protein BEL55_004360 [Salmonella enterica subsp. enterica serovar Waycross]|nr:hypothetical protein [Salmonella enterica subsp. enterica serovar Waycross]